MSPDRAADGRAARGSGPKGEKDDRMSYLRSRERRGHALLREVRHDAPGFPRPRVLASERRPRAAADSAARIPVGRLRAPADAAAVPLPDLQPAAGDVSAAAAADHRRLAADA